MTGRPQDYRYEAAASSRDAYDVPDDDGNRPGRLESDDDRIREDVSAPMQPIPLKEIPVSRFLFLILVGALVSASLLVGCRSERDALHTPERFDPYGPETTQYTAFEPGRSRFDPYASKSARYDPYEASEFPRADSYEASADRTTTYTTRSRVTGNDTTKGETPYEGPFDDQRFVEQASRGGLFEVESSRLALEQRSSQETRKFARMMIDDHGKTNQELATLARSKSLRASADLDNYHQEKLDELRHVEGAEFDVKYRQCQIKAHDEAIALFERASRECKDAELKAFATRLLPTLRDHRAQLDSTVIDDESEK